MLRPTSSRSSARLRATLLAAAFHLVAVRSAPAQEGVFLSEAEAPRAVFPAADRFEKSVTPVSDVLQQQVRSHLETPPSMWETSWVRFSAYQADTLLGRAYLVEEIGKHRPITFIVGVTAAGRIADVAVVAYREAYGGEIASKRFLSQYRDKDDRDSLKRGSSITNIGGATLSVDAASRAVHKALALGKVLDAGENHAN